MRSGDPLNQEVLFSEGFPDGDVTWVLRDGDGTQVDTNTITPVAGDVSVLITVSGANNTIAGSELFEFRELSWSYEVSGVRYADQRRYRLEAFLKFGVSEEGVRFKLGIETHEISNEAIDLVKAYSNFETTVTSALLAAITTGAQKLAVRDAIEALAALPLVPTLQVKVAQREVSGVSQFQRAKIDWDKLIANLNELVAEGYTTVDPTIDPSSGFGSLFITVVRTDPITGAAPAN